MSLNSPAAGKPTNTPPIPTIRPAALHHWQSFLAPEDSLFAYLFCFLATLGCLCLGLNLTVFLGTAKTASSLSTVCPAILPGRTCDLGATRHSRHTRRFRKLPGRVFSTLDPVFMNQSVVFKSSSSKSHTSRQPSRVQFSSPQLRAHGGAAAALSIWPPSCECRARRMAIF